MASERCGDLLARIAHKLTQYESQGLSSYLHSSRRGLKHSSVFTERDEPSASSTAAVLALKAEYPEFDIGIDDSLFGEWRVAAREAVKSAGALTTWKAATSTSTVKAAYYMSHRCLGAGIAPPRVLETWLRSYCLGWLGGETPRVPAMHLLHLVLRSIASPKRRTKDLAGSVASTVLWRNLASTTTGLTAYFRPVELALSLCHTSREVPVDSLRKATSILNEVAQASGTWPAHPPITNTGFPTCSSLTAWLALMGSHGHQSPVVTALLPSLQCHVEWLLSTRSEDAVWPPPDLSFRHQVSEPWFNCLAVRFLKEASECLRQDQEAFTLRKYRTRYDVESPVQWKQLLLEPQIHQALTKAFVAPVKGRGSRRACTAILFGPPGTAKSTVAESLAAEIRWPLVELGVADFLAEGLERVFATSQQIFEDLLQLQDVVVLLDEVEGVFTSREDNEAEMLQSLLTASLLPPLKRLHDDARIILLIATNHIRRFDAAVQRPGRIDLIIPVGPPSRGGRQKLLVDVCGLREAVARKVSERLPNRTTIGEICMAKGIEGAVSLAYGDFMKAWKRLHRERYVISEAVYESFINDVNEFARY